MVLLAIIVKLADEVQLSEEFEFMFDAVIVAAPNASKFTVKSVQIAFGICLSKTVIVKMQSVELPAVSVARNVTVLVAPSGPAADGNADPLGKLGATSAAVTPQLSVATGVANTTFALHRSTLLFTVILDGQLIKTGCCISCTITVTEQVAVLLLLSLTVYTTTVCPKGIVAPIKVLLSGAGA